MYGYVLVGRLHPRDVPSMVIYPMLWSKTAPNIHSCLIFPLRTQSRGRGEVTTRLSASPAVLGAGCSNKHGLLWQTSVPHSPGQTGIVVEMKAALFALADGFYSPQQAGGACAKGISCWAREVQFPAAPLPGRCARQHQWGKGLSLVLLQPKSSSSWDSRPLDNT